jgi:nitrite reductase/ring-hydroxylating ferredoxin subunit
MSRRGGADAPPLSLLLAVEEAGGQEDQRDHEGELGVLERVKVEAHEAVHCPCHAACEP